MAMHLINNVIAKKYIPLDGMKINLITFIIQMMQLGYSLANVK